MASKFLQRNKVNIIMKITVTIIITRFIYKFIVLVKHMTPEEDISTTGKEHDNETFHSPVGTLKTV